MLDLESAIIHCEEVAEFSDRECMYERFYGEKEMKRKCAEEHRQLAGWLKLLKRILDSGDCNDCALQNSQCRYAPRWGEQVRYNCPFYARENNDK